MLVGYKVAIEQEQSKLASTAEREQARPEVTVDAVKAIHSSLRQNLSITLLPTDQWHIVFGAEHYYTRFSTDQTASITFLDASVRWLLSKNIDLSLTATNLLDETDYRYTSFGSLSESFYTFNIRPRNIIIKMQIKL
ncbi:MAG: TonB-dependent receptor [Bacteroidaceae bacterium]|nr:TonB-dependent receptor [Bacteroidaceae bacterium]